MRRHMPSAPSNASDDQTLELTNAVVQKIIENAGCLQGAEEFLP